ncbi:aspartate kinase [Thalassococcus sp. S3]|uniref:aspartate kinase n=1 Tax=Thalassococcus sp. S3 TaxID=2017482 RepID=UPI00102479CF|nr:aspartate kinase [Thalassococcus sp. S3]QBF29898.1 aspartate kinase [Thalassococcus sp. S3]
MTHIVEKIGGTSMSRLNELCHTLFIRNGTPRYGRYFVVSAFAGITNLLLEHKKSGQPGVYMQLALNPDDRGWRDALSKTSHAMIAAHQAILSHPDDIDAATGFVQDRMRETRTCLADLKHLCSYGGFRLEEQLSRVREMLAGLGEMHSAYATTLFLRRHGLEARCVDLSGWRDKSNLALDDRIRKSIRDIDPEREMPIITGYAQCKSGLMQEFDRGYSEVTFSRLAAIIRAREAVIRKEYHLSSADPLLVGAGKARKIGHTSYDLADQMANLGMEAIHPSAARTLRQAKVPLRVTNVFEPEDPGTLINARDTETPAVEMIAGLDVFALEVFEQDEVDINLLDVAILNTIGDHGLRIVSKTINANTITHYVDAKPAAIDAVADDLGALYPNARISACKLVLISVLGHDLQGLSVPARALQALAKAGITPRCVLQGPRGVETQLILDAGLLETGIRSLHAELKEDVAKATTIAA